MSVARPDSSLRRWIRQAAIWASDPRAMPVVALALILMAGQLAFALIETVWLGLPMVREAPPRFDVAHVGEMVFTFSAAWLFVRALVAARASPSMLGSEPMSALQIVAGAAAIFAGLGSVALFLFDPGLFHLVAQEDRPLEWISALLLLGASALFVRLALRHRESLPAAAIALALATILFVLGMEEISWMQRLFGFSTPETLARVNWQSEFNLHNVQTDLSETLYYVGGGLFLIGLPLLRDLLPASALSNPWTRWLPPRITALLAAPLALLNYGHWNLYAVQLVTMLAFFAFLAWARAAAKRGDRVEEGLFVAAALALALGQTLMLCFGSAMVELPDSTEYKELFIALGFAGFAIAASKSAVSA